MVEECCNITVSLIDNRKVAVIFIFYDNKRIKDKIVEDRGIVMHKKKEDYYQLLLKFTFKDKNNTPRYVNVDFPIAQPAKNNTY